jgi:hypothetical protein
MVSAQVRISLRLAVASAVILSGAVPSCLNKLFQRNLERPGSAGG